MKLLLIGADGQLGRHILPCLTSMGDVLASSRQGGEAPCDLSDSAALARLLDDYDPDLVLNAAAWTAVDAAEDEPEAAQVLNEHVPDQLAQWCLRRGALLVHYSTDYVFSGNPGRPWTEQDPAAPKSTYGRTKLAGEEAVRHSGAHALILRTAWVYSRAPGNFLTAILNRAARGESLSVVSDQVGSPTWAGSLARMTAAMLRCRSHWNPGLTLHAVDRGSVSWFEFARMAVTMAAGRGLIDREVPIEPIGTADWPQKACRPRWSVLDVAALERWTGMAAWPVHRALAACLDDWKDERC